MTPLADIAAAVRDCVVAAWVDTRTGEVCERVVADARHDPAFIATALDVATEVMRSRERPPRMVLLSPHHVHIVQRLARDPHRVLVVVCARSANLGLAVALVRSFTDAGAEAA
ncbi:MAG TPA: hypothetical protein VFP84_10770 [Kofleriaceae bacterium]|nr:hypothetical protein [Kofleriaceae bacterium]